MIDKFTKDYYEHGIEKGVSLYSNYRWIPELTIPLAYRLTRNLNIKDSDKIFDFGCAMGYLVKAFRILGFDAWGFDSSEYAIDNVPTDIKDYVFHSNVWMNKKWDWIICKDVLEHQPYNFIDSLIKNLRSCSRNILVIVPLSEDGRQYNEPAYELDKTHIIRENITWWSNVFQSHLIEVISADYKMNGVKENWSMPLSNGFFILKTNIL